MLTLKETLTTKISTVQVMDNGILHVNIKPNSVIIVDDINELLDATHKIGNGQKFKKLITLGEYTLADLDAIKLFSSEEGSKYKIAEAFVINGLAQCILVNFYMYVIKPLTPVKLFTNETDAQNWLLSLE